jgi:pimeloyl-ACP methyl ester carboxylesterase
MKMNRKAGTVLALVLGLAVLLTACDPPGDSPIEAAYSDAGPYTAKSKRVTGFTIFYPTQLEGNHPIITWGNGTSAPTMVYSPLLNHLASWGFVVIASDSVMTQSGDDLIAGIDYLIEQNETAGSEFYGMLDTGRIGTSGHSQGGGGAINAATDSRVTCSVPIAPSPGSIRQVDGPIFLVAGRSDFLVSAALVRSTSYAPADGPTVFGIVDGMGHVAFTGNAGNARGYITAWFMYHLQGDEYAGEAFIGDCEICSKSNWEVESKNFP